MTWQLDLLLMLVLIGIAVLALELRDLLASVVGLMAYGFLMALLFAEMGAVDVALTQAVLEAGVVGVIMIVTLSGLERRSRD